MKKMLPTHRRPTPPGKILLEEFPIPLGLTRIKFVKYLGGSWTQSKLSAIISGKQPITGRMLLIKDRMYKVEVTSEPSAEVAAQVDLFRGAFIPS